MLIRLGHSPDPDDAFMFWALAAHQVDTRGLEFEHVLKDMSTLNAWAREGRLEVTAVSLHTYPLVQDTYGLLPHGAAMGSGYGPVVVSRRPLAIEELSRVEVAIAAKTTTAYLVLKMLVGGTFSCREVGTIGRVVEEVAAGRAEAGLVVGEEQLTYAARELHKVVDLGEWWLLETGLPLPLTVNVAKRELGGETLRTLSDVLLESIETGLANRREALRYATRFGGGDDDVTERLVAMYVNELTCDYGDEGREAVRELFSRAHAVGALERPVAVDFVA